MAICIEGKVFVPEISEEKLNRLSKKIVPVITQDNKLYQIEIPDLRNTAYTWDYKITAEYIGLKEIKRIKTNHYCGYYGLFKPSISEVLSQIPEDLVNNVCAFEIISDVESGTEDEIKIFNYGNGHLATTILYQLT